MNIKNPKKLLSVPEVSEYLCIPLKSVYYLTEIGKIKGIKVGRRWRYHLNDVEFYYQNGTNGKTISYNITSPARDIQDIAERRAFPRLNCSIFCSYKIFVPSLKEFFSTGSIRNISENGVFLNGLPNDLENILNGDPIDLDFYISLETGEKANISSLGRIVRKTENGVGIKFRNINKNSQDLITKYVG